MRTVSIVSASGEAAGTAELPDEIFDVQANVPLIHQVVVAQQAAARQGTHATRTRGQVRGGGKKPYRQKGTGRARQGSVRAPQYAGGGIVHGPVPRSYVQRTPKKMKAAALKGALSERARHDRVHVVSSFAGDEPKTKDAVAVLSGITGTRRGAGALVVAEAGDDLTRKSLRNAPGVHVLAVGQLNTYDVLASDHVVFTERALAALLARMGGAAKAGLAEAGLAEAELAGPGPAEAGLAETELAGPGPAEAALAEAELAGPGSAEAELAETDLAETGPAETGPAEEASK